MAEAFLNGRVTLHCGDCLKVLATLPECSMDSVVSDPPYHLTSIVKRFGSPTAKPVRVGDITATNDLKAAHARAAAGFMGKVWDGGDIAFRPETWAEVLRVLKPGGYIVAFSSSRTYHRMACAIEDAGFITHPLIGWVFATGFPKAHSVSKHIDRMSGAEREVVATGNPVKRMIPGADQNKVGWEKNNGREYVPNTSEPATPEAAQWDGWFYGAQSLKPALEPIYVGQKPFERGLNGTQNILKWGTGAINVGACRVGTENTQQLKRGGKNDFPHEDDAWTPKDIIAGSACGRWPANLIHDGSEEVVGAFPDTGATSKPGTVFKRASAATRNGNTGSALGAESRAEGECMVAYGDSGSAARFFYSAKAGADDRLGSKHPTVKPVDLMQYLIRLVTPPAGVCLDPFCGTGTTGEAAWREGMHAILIEAEVEYQADVRRRMELALAGPDEKAHAIVKAKGLTEGPGPLFDWGGDYDAHKDVEGSFSEAYRAIRERVAAGGPGWTPRCDSTDDLFDKPSIVRGQLPGEYPGETQSPRGKLDKGGG